MSDILSPPLSAEEQPALRPQWGELGPRALPAQRWLWHGYLARGAVTLLTSQWKTGKTTLLSVLLNKLGDGGLPQQNHCRDGDDRQQSGSSR